MLREPCPNCGGIQVRYQSRIICVNCGDLRGIEAAKPPPAAKDVVTLLRDAILACLKDLTEKIQLTEDTEAQLRTTELVNKYLDALHRIQELLREEKAKK